MDLLALLKWKAHPDRVMDILGRLRNVSGEEIVKVRSILRRVGTSDKLTLKYFSVELLNIQKVSPSVDH